MKILYFDDFKLGVLKGDKVVDVSAAVKDIPHSRRLAMAACFRRLWFMFSREKRWNTQHTPTARR